MRVIYKRTAVKDMEATRDYIAGRLKNPKAAKKLVTALMKAIPPRSRPTARSSQLTTGCTRPWVSSWV